VSVMVKIGLAAVVLWLLAHMHVFLIYRTSLLSLLIFILGGLIVAGLMIGKRNNKEAQR
jgi:hypothetical protein